MKIKGIKKLCGATKNLSPDGYLPRYKIQVHVDIKAGELYWADVVGSGYILYHDPDLLFVCNIEHPTTMKEIKQMVEERVNRFVSAN